MEYSKKRYKRRSTSLSDLPSPLPLYTCGVDEAGRGPLAGPVVASCVIFPGKEVICNIDENYKKERIQISYNHDENLSFETHVLPFLKDSKKTTVSQREKLFPMILQLCQVGIGYVDADAIDRLGIKHATHKAMLEALSKLPKEPSILLVDGNDGFDFDMENHPVIKGDEYIPQISAASIVAKVVRDTLLKEYAMDYPQYGFEQHKGYGTKLHRMRIVQHGLSPIHRASYCRSIHVSAS